MLLSIKHLLMAAGPLLWISVMAWLAPTNTIIFPTGAATFVAYAWGVTLLPGQKQRGALYMLAATASLALALLYILAGNASPYARPASGQTLAVATASMR